MTLNKNKLDDYSNVNNYYVEDIKKKKHKNTNLGRKKHVKTTSKIRQRARM